MKRLSLYILLMVWACSTSMPKEDDLMAVRKRQIATAMQMENPLIQLDRGKEMEGVQRLLLKDQRMKELFHDPNDGSARLNEVFQISPARPSDLKDYDRYCRDGSCLRLDVYNYTLNMTVVAIVNKKISSVVHLNYFAGMQPEIPEHLASLALEIARKDAKVIEGWGCEPGWGDSRMEATKTALKATKCQRSQHLCVAPTFVRGDKALWAIVDLTDLEVVGIKWTSVNETGPALTERAVQNDMVMDCYCLHDNHMKKGDWEFDYSLTRSDGMEVKNVKYRGTPILHSAKVVDWHVSYSETSEFGYSDAIGCPEFSQAAVIATEPPNVMWLLEEADTLGFVLEQNYYSDGWPTPCSYNYQQRYEFYNDGSFRPVIASLGRGCGVDGMYRPVTRISFVGKDWTFERMERGTLNKIQSETWFKEDEGYEYYQGDLIGRMVSKAGQQIKIEANKGQFGDKSRGDNAYVYLTRYKPDAGEGDGDLPTIGPCCNTDYHQGPEKFIEPHPEALEGQEIVIWYVPEIKNDGREGHQYCWAESFVEGGLVKTKVYPCMSGPKFKIEI